MKTAILGTLLAACATAASANTRSWDFRVLLDGAEIGEHRFTLKQDGDARELRSTAQYRVRVLLIEAYRYRHEASERWRGDCLEAIASQTETNGEREAVNAVLRDGRLSVERQQGGRTARDEHAGCVMSFAYWNPRMLKAQRLINSQTGELLPVRIAALGEESVPVRGRPLRAERHQLTGPGLKIDLWYADGEWVALEAPARGGRLLRYELR